MQWVAGVDGCRAGWVVALLGAGSDSRLSIDLRCCRSFREVLSLSPTPSIIAVDIPIGLLDKPVRGGRTCDREARKLLGDRRSCVFSPPTRKQLKATSLPEAQVYGPMTKQCLAIIPKIREVDEIMTPHLQSRVREVHPEVSFTEMAGGVMQHRKKTAQGRRERLEAIKMRLPDVHDSVNDAAVPGAAPDDILDACAAAWTALRILRNEAKRIPTNEELDSHGLRMEMWY
jgi:predicted RNase H-like nuclease